MPWFPLGGARKLSEEARAVQVFGDFLAKMSEEHGRTIKGRKGRETLGGGQTEGHSLAGRLM